MKFPKYWIKANVTGIAPGGKKITLSAFGWSTVSQDEARQLAETRARRAIESGFASGKQRDYEYGDAPFREEKVETIENNGTEVSVISRNRYGAHFSAVIFNGLNPFGVRWVCAIDPG